MAVRLPGDTLSRSTTALSGPAPDEIVHFRLETPTRVELGRVAAVLGSEDAPGSAIGHPASGRTFGASTATSSSMLAASSARSSASRPSSGSASPSTMMPAGSYRSSGTPQHSLRSSPSSPATSASAPTGSSSTAATPRPVARWVTPSMPPSSASPLGRRRDGSSISSVPPSPETAVRTAGLLWVFDVIEDDVELPRGLAALPRRTRSFPLGGSTRHVEDGAVSAGSNLERGRHVSSVGTTPA